VAKLRARLHGGARLISEFRLNQASYVIGGITQRTGQGADWHMVADLVEDATRRSFFKTRVPPARPLRVLLLRRRNLRVVQL